jgi:hypothetical protein
MMLSRQYETIRYKVKEETFQQYCLKFDRVVRDLNGTGANMDEMAVVMKFLWSLPSDYENVVQAIETVELSRLDMAFVRGRIEEYEMLRSKSGPSSSKSNVAFSARGMYKGRFVFSALF